MHTEETALAGVQILRPRRINDIRGYYQESWSAARLAEAGVRLDFVQESQSFTRAPGTVRGLHVQMPPKAQVKLMRVLTGEVAAVAVDIRQGSVTYGQHERVTLSATNGRQLLVPEGFLHGFVTRHPNTTVLTKATNPFDAALTQRVHFADPELAIDWGLPARRLVVGHEEMVAPAFAGWASPFQHAGAAA